MKLLLMMSFFILGILMHLSASASDVHDHDHGHEHYSGAESQGESHEHEENEKSPSKGNQEKANILLDEHDHEENSNHKKHDHSSDEHSENESSHERHHDEQATKIENDMAVQVGIETSRATAQWLQQTIVVYGSLATGPEQLSHVRARYSGLIKLVKPTLGDQVKQGDLLAKVESNESLKIYNIRAPIAGTIIQRHANTGEVTQDQVLFSIANFDTLWAEFRIYPSHQRLIKPGLTTHIEVNNIDVGGPIQHIIPALDKPYQLARVVFDNKTSGLTPGLLVEGRVVTSEFKATLAVERNGLQKMGEQTGVFIKQGAEYTFTPITLGRQDDRYAEVLRGLQPGQLYVNKNSYLIKADIEKSEAEHEH